MKVLLATPPGKTTELWPPLGLMYIASSMRRVGIPDVHIIDAFCENLSTEELVSRVEREHPDVFGINCSTHTFLSALETVKQVKERLPQTRIVMGGFHATFAAEKIVQEYPFVDFVLKGEAELSFPELIHHVEKGTEPNDVDGITYSKDGRTVDTPASLIQDLDSLPLPSRDLVDKVEYGYSHQGIKLTFGKFTTVCTSRGCPFSCRFCSCAAFTQRKWRARSAENVVDELQMLQSEGYESAVMVDDNFTHNRKRVERICELIREKRIKMQFYCEGRADNASYEMLRTMKRAGFNVIYFGVESASPTVLKYFGKTVRTDLARAALANAKRAGMVACASFIFGAPVETDADANATIEFIRQTRPHVVQINALDCLIGTPIWDELAAKGLLGPDDWKKNHRIWEYNKETTKEKVAGLVNAGNSAYIESWLDMSAVPGLLSLLLRNKTARRVAFGNLLNPDLRKRIREGFQRSPDKAW